MGIVGKLFGTPPDHKEEKKEHEIVKAPEFDVTQYAKKLAVVIGVLAPAIAGTLKALKIEHVSSGMVIGAFGVTAAALLGVSLVMAVDVAARAYLTVGKPVDKEADKTTDEDGKSKGEIAAAPPGTSVWLEGDDEPHPLLAIAGDGSDSSSYLIASGPTIERRGGGKDVTAIDGSAKWHPASDVRAIRPREWP
ncbi:MAG TPA: hypothetical protein VGC63_10735 [Solirubrobacterales bacterium]|jgi:hypothetical protein